MMLLDEIVAFKHQEVALRPGSKSLHQQRIAQARPPRDFLAGLREGTMSAIAEIKPKSPSRGVFKQAADATSLALQYQSSGASALSVLADREFFGGGPELVERIATDSRIHLPILYKEFVVAPQQIYEARACAADAVLLIARAVGDDKLRDLIDLTNELGMVALVETFHEKEVTVALAAGAQALGINNRDLRTFEVDLKRSDRLSKLIPDDVIKVSESGISSRGDVTWLEELGFDAILVGEALLTAADPGAKLMGLLGLEKTQS